MVGEGIDVAESAARLIARAEKLFPPAAYHAFPLVAARAEGSRIFDPDGRSFLDFTSGIAVLSTGHRHPRVLEAVRDQLEKVVHTCSVVAYHEVLVDLAEELLATAPGMGMVFFGNSGAEGVEAALKLAMYVTGRPAFLAFRGGFHGRTAGALGVTSSKASFRKGYGAYLPHVQFVSYPYPFRSPHPRERVVEAVLAEMEEVFATSLPPEEVAAVVVEPVLGEGGYVPAPPGFLRELRELTRRHGILLIADEVQTGVGRTGRWWAVEHEGVEPDIMVAAKGLASGFPLGACMGRADLMEAWPPGAHGTTFGGNPISAAAALATLRVVKEEGLLENAARLGGLLLQELGRATGRDPGVGEVRGLGLMVGVELVKPGGKEPDPERTERVQKEAFRRGLLLLTCGPYRNVLRFVPPLTVREAEIAEAVGIFAEALEASREL